MPTQQSPDAPSGKPPDQPDQPAETPAGRGSFLRRVVPWMVAAGMLAWLFHVVPAAELAAAVRRAPLGLFAGLVVVYVIAVLLTDSFATWATFRWSLPEAGLTLREALEVRGASYILAILHYGAGQGGLAYFVSRAHKVPL